jgi:hypothetical protein
MENDAQPKFFWRFIGHILSSTDAFRHLHREFGYADGPYLQVHRPVRFPGAYEPDEAMVITQTQRDYGPYVLRFVLNTEAEYVALCRTWNGVLNSHDRRPRLSRFLHQDWMDLGRMLDCVTQFDGDKSPLMIIRRLYAIDSEAAWRAFWYTVHHHPSQIEFMHTHVMRYLIKTGPRDMGHNWLAARDMALDTLRQVLNPPGGGGGTPEWLDQAGIRSLLKRWRCYVRYDRTSGTYQVVSSETNLPIPPRVQV